MRLVELLAMELIEWPQNARAVQNRSRRVHFFNCEFSFTRDVWAGDDASIHRIDPACMPRLATDHATAIVTREQWQAERRRIEAAEKHAGKWNGEGLPPIGAQVMFENNQCEVIGHHEGVVVCAMDDYYENGCYDGFLATQLRPIDTRTPREKWIDEAMGIMKVHESWKHVMGNVYDAGLAKLPEDGE